MTEGRVGVYLEWMDGQGSRCPLHLQQEYLCLGSRAGPRSTLFMAKKRPKSFSTF